MFAEVCAQLCIFQVERDKVIHVQVQNDHPFLVESSKQTFIHISKYTVSNVITF